MSSHSTAAMASSIRTRLARKNTSSMMTKKTKGSA